MRGFAHRIHEKAMRVLCRRLLLFGILAGLLCASPVFAAQEPAPVRVKPSQEESTSDEESTAAAKDIRFVYDGAGILTEDEEEQLEREAAGLSDHYDCEILLVTARDTHGKSAQSYAEDFFAEMAEDEDGAVFLIDLDNREIYLATSGTLRFVLNDDRVDELLDLCFADVVQRDYAGAFSDCLRKLSGFLRLGAVEGTFLKDKDTGEVTRYRAPKRIRGWEALTALAAALVSGGSLFLVTVRRYKRKAGSLAYDWQDHCQLRLSVREDRLVNRFVTHRHMPKAPPPSQSGPRQDAPQSTVHTGSDDRSYGGGGRKF